MKDLFYISKSLALKIHQQQVERFGGIQGVRDGGLLESALEAAANLGLPKIVKKRITR